MEMENVSGVRLKGYTTEENLDPAQRNCDAAMDGLAGIIIGQKQSNKPDGKIVYGMVLYRDKTS